MNLAHVEQVADAILFEGYLLYPYRSTALKNHARWTFGVLCPRSDSEARGGLDAWSLQCECLLTGGPETRIESALRFLHPRVREVSQLAAPVLELTGSADLQPVDSLKVGERWLESAPEASVVRIDAGPFRIAELEGGGVHLPFVREERRDLDPVRDGTGLVVGALARGQERLEGALELVATRVAEHAYKLGVRVSNLTPPAREAPMAIDSAAYRSLASTHVVLGVQSGEFVSLMDPPPDLRAQAESCRNLGAWPILAGPRGRRDTVLCSPIILEDHPQVAPESPGDFFDGTEIDELLTLRILTLTDEERRRMAAADERTRALLERTDAGGEEQLTRLHGALRRSPRDRRPDTLPVAGVPLGAGDRVRLRPRGRSDIFDLALTGRSATIVSVEQDYEDRVYFTVTVDDDPGRDLGLEGRPGHRFFFGPEEVEPLRPDEAR